MGLLLGRTDPPLDDEGRRQAERLGDTVGRVDRVITSPLLRALATAEAIDGPVEVDERWIELDYGEFDGRPVKDSDTSTWAEWRSDPRFTPPGGETLAALGERVRAACEDVADAAAEGDIVVVSHVSPIKAAVAWVLSAGDDVTWHMFVAPASITRAAVTPRGVALHSFNEVAHLGPPD